MGASNFHKVNASQYYAVLMHFESPVILEDGSESPELEYHVPDVEDTNDFVYCIQEDAKEKSDQLKVFYNQTISEDPYELRSYPARSLFQFYRRKSFGDIDLTVNINCVIRWGYYEGGVLDWFMTYELDGDTLEEINFYDCVTHYSEMNPGMIKIQTKSAEKWATKATDELIEIIENIFKEHSMPLKVEASFSNGETIYSKS
jgi:hypothetical protein